MTERKAGGKIPKGDQDKETIFVATTYDAVIYS